MENYTRIPDSIRKDKTLSPLHKMIIGYLSTYQTKPDGTSTNLVYFNTQEKLAEELGTPIRTLKTAIEFLELKQIIYQPKKGDMDGKRYYKNRKAIVLVDEFHKLPIEFKILEEAAEVTISTQEIPEVQVEENVSEIEENDTKIKFDKPYALFDYYELIKFDESLSSISRFNPDLKKLIESFRNRTITLEQLLIEANKLK
jgi:hypothetical protein